MKKLKNLLYVIYNKKEYPIMDKYNVLKIFIN